MNRHAPIGLPRNPSPTDYASHHDEADDEFDTIIRAAHPLLRKSLEECRVLFVDTRAAELDEADADAEGDAAIDRMEWRRQA